MSNDPDIDLTDDKQDARAEPTSSKTELDVDIADEDAKETREKRKNGELTLDDIEDDELREAARKAREQEDEQDEDDDSQQVRVSEGESPLEAIANNETDRNSAATGDEDEGDDGDGLMDGVSDDDVEDAMDMDLNVRDDIDPEHFDYNDQDFSVFGGYGQSVTIEYNSVLFRLDQPSDREQEALINNMGSMDDGMNMTDMMEALIEATVEKPDDIGDLTADWSPFERMGLGMQCMEFLGLDALGNM